MGRDLVPSGPCRAGRHSADPVNAQSASRLASASTRCAAFLDRDTPPGSSIGTPACGSHYGEGVGVGGDVGPVEGVPVGVGDGDFDCLCGGV